MNELLDAHWRDGKPPFDGHVLVVDAELAPDELVVALGETVRVLRARYGSSALCVNEDWHDHDGYINSDKNCTWDELASWVSSIEAIRASCSDDFMVHTLVFSTDLAFCLRYWFEQDPGDFEATSCFDLSADDDTLRQVADALVARGFKVSMTKTAREYFAMRESK